MDLPKFDNINNETLTKTFKELAKSYTPEWNCDFDQNDFGITVSKIFIELFEGNITRLNKAFYNYYITFLNLIGIQPHPPRSAEGFAFIEAVKNSNGTYIKKGEKLTAISNDSEEINFETKEDIFVIDTQIKSILLVDSKFNGGTVVKVFDKDQLTKKINQENNDDEFKITSFRLMDCTGYENLNKRFIYFEDSILFDTNKTEITFYFYNKFSLEKEKKLLDFFSSKNAIWQYFDGIDWKRIENVMLTEDKGVKIYFDTKSIQTNIMGKFSNFIRCSPDTFYDLEITNILYYPSDKKVLPEKLISEEEEIENTKSLPFGEKLLIHNCFYIKSDKTFTKINSKIEININFKLIVFKSQIKEKFKSYRFMMNDLDFAEIEPSDSSIEKVIWEYWNGIGWTKLDIKLNLNNDENEINNINIDSNGIFKPFSGTRDITLNFICPIDFKKIVIKSEEGYFIRARIAKINNPYDSMANNIVPFINNISINCSYQGRLLNFENVFTEFKSKNKIVNFSNNNEPKILLESIKEEDLIMYICLTKAPKNNGVIRIFFDIEDVIDEKRKLSFKWEYFSKKNTQNTNGHWRVLNTIDLTDGFSHSETVSIIGFYDFEKINIYGNEGYFLRIVNIGEKLRNTPNDFRPFIKDIKINVIKVIQKTTYEPQYFPISRGEENKICKLSNKNISEATVWVNEFGKLSTFEENYYKNIGKDFAILEFDKLGILEKIWIKWNPIDNILAANPNDRVYQINYSNSEIIFGNGKTGKIPPSGYGDTIKIYYSSCDGIKGNIDKNAINDFSSVIPNISSITNFKSFNGGTNLETIEESSKRMFTKICGGRRIISLSDFEDSILFNDSSLDKVKCIAHMNKYSEKSIGSFSIAVLPKKFPCGFEKFIGIKKRILDFINNNASASFIYGNKELSVFEVMYVDIKTNITAYIDDFNSYQYVYKNIEYEIKSFLNPVNGGFSHKGWEIGDIIRANSIKNCLKEIKHLKWVSNIVLFNKIVTKKGKEDISIQDLEKMKFIIPLFGGTEINLKI